ncbi:MAG: phosphoribosylamine--glycine ligase [Bacilli bacterium]|nr:phosphoribosylamine--glycine ligase [Bacilli bacterium]
MKVLVIGSGGREHAIAYYIAASKHKPQVFVAKGNAGMTCATLVNINESDNKALVRFALKEKIDLTIVGPEAALSNGIVDDFRKNNLLIFGPTKEASKIESSKKFAKELMEKYDIPTAKYKAFNDYEESINYIKNNSLPIVIKYDGLAAGKGVVIAATIEEADTFLKEIFFKNKYDTKEVVIEEFLEGPEFSLMAFVNKEKVYPMEIAQDHKRAYDNDLGPNTGGMGAYSPVNIISKEDIEYSVKNIMEKTAKALVSEGICYLGVLYGGLMKTKDGIKVIEFNARFGDPETEVVLPRLKNDLLDVILNVIAKKDFNLKWINEVCLGVVMASVGYPNDYKKNCEINNIPNEEVFHMGTKIEDGKIVNNGGRVLMVLGKGKTFLEAQEKAYKKVKMIESKNLFYRKDIGYQMIK